MPKSLTKAQIVEAIAEQNGLPKNEAKEIVETLLEIMKRTLESGEDIQSLAGQDFPHTGCFDGRGERLAVGTNDGSVTVYEVASGQVIFEHRDRAGRTNLVALSNDGHRVAASFTNSIKWWPLEQ